MSEPDKVIYPLHNVFVKSGLPRVTYVEPEVAILLKLALTQPVRAIIVEGLAGTGKTITMQQIIDHLVTDVQNVSPHLPKFLNPSIQKDLQDILTLQEWHAGTVVVDSFHNLDAELRENLTHYLINLTNETDIEKKLVIIGTLFTHQTLVDIPPQFTKNDIEVYRFERTDEDPVPELIRKGEEALNIFFEDKEKIIQIAYGDLNLAQRLCHDLCALAHVTQTQEDTKHIPLQIASAIKQTMVYLDYRFTKAIKFFISYGNTDDTICWHLLEKIAFTEDGSLSLSHFKEQEPSRAYEIDRLIDECWIDSFYKRHPEAVNYLFFDKKLQKLIINDRQLFFYLRHRDLSILAQEVGKIPKRPQVFISYSHSDADCMERLMMCLKPIERDLLIKPWVDTEIKDGQIWKEEIEKALNNSKAAILLISAPFWASDFIVKYELSTLLANAKARGTKIIPVILSPSDFDHTDVRRFQSINDPHNPVRGPGKTVWDWDAVFVKVLNSLREYFHGGITRES